MVGGLLDASIVNLESGGPRSQRPGENPVSPRPWENPQMVVVRGQRASVALMLAVSGATSMSPSSACDLSIPDLLRVLTKKFNDEYSKIRGMLSPPASPDDSLEQEVSGTRCQCDLD